LEGGFGRALAVDEVGDAHLALQRPLDRGGDPLGPAQLVLVPVEGAREHDGVERAAVRGGEDLGVDDVAAPPPRRRPVTMASRRGWSGESTVSSVTPRNWSVSKAVATVRPASSASA
jgi:hypothetical protein